jgi:NDP-sugar pyrophosphorylase family protein
MLYVPCSTPASLAAILQATARAGGAIRHAMRSQSLTEALVANGDTLLTGDLAPLMAPLQLAQGEQVRMAAAIVSERDRFGGVQADSQRWVTAFLEKGTQGNGAIYVGFYRLHRDALARVTQDAFSLEQ